MKHFVLFAATVQLLWFQQSISAQPLDTLLPEFNHIENIFPLDDTTFILIGSIDLTCRVARIDAHANFLWSVELHHIGDYNLKSFDIRLNDNDSSVQVLMRRFECDYAPPQVQFLTTLDFNGSLIDFMETDVINSFEPVFLLSGREDFPRYARIIEDRVVLFFANGDTTILGAPFPNDTLHKPILVDMCPSGDISVCYDLDNRIMIYRIIEGRYQPVSGGATFPGEMTSLICIDHNNLLLVDDKNVYLVDTVGVTLNSFGPSDYTSFSVRWKKPYVYPHALSFQDSFYVLDENLNEVYREVRNPSGQLIEDMVIHHQFTYKTGEDNTYPRAGYLESVNQVTLEGLKYFDLQFIDFTLGPPDMITSTSECTDAGNIYQLPELSIQLKNNGDHVIDQVIVHYTKGTGWCCRELYWYREINNMNLLPGESRTFTLDDVSFVRMHPGQAPFEICITVFRPDQHADDHAADNRICKNVILTSVQDSDDVTFPNNFPNPVVDQLHFQFAGANQFAVNLFDLQGELILSKQINETDDVLDVMALTPGVYFLQYRSEEGISLVEKLVKM